jgi:hypothetical protein
MVRLISHLLGFLALLLAPLPAAALAPPSPAVLASPSEHCEDTGAGASHRDAEDKQEEGKHPCCKNSAGSCCPAAASFAGTGPAQPGIETDPAHRAQLQAFPLGSAVPPLTEPPTFA